MTEYENLMVTAMEECAEIQQEISKALRFGKKDHHPDEPEITNEERVMIEYHHLRAVMEMLQMKGYIKGLRGEDSSLVYRNKIDKIELFQQYSREAGTISEERKEGK